METTFALGQHVKTYRSNPIKSILNLIITGGLLLSGAYIVIGQLQYHGKLDAFAILGGILFLVGVLMAWLMYRQLRSFVRIHENGVTVREGTWLFTELDMLQAMGRMKANNPRSVRIPQGAAYFANDKRAFGITSDVTGSQAANEEIQRRILAVQIPKLMDKLKNGQVVTFDKVVAGNYIEPKPFPITFSREGILLPDKTFLGWMLLRGLTVERDQWNSMVGIIKLTNGSSIVFNMENSRQSILVYHLLEACLKTKF